MKYKVVASREELESIGISQDITNVEVLWIKDFPTGYSVVKTKAEQHIIDILGEEKSMIFYDIPKIWLKLIE